MTHDIFISYRRRGGEHLAGRIADALKSKGFAAFMDVDDLRAGKFDEALVGTIHEAKDVLVILTPGCLERCNDESDWLRREIREAIRQERNIVPIVARGFEMPCAADLPDDIASLPSYQALLLDHELFNECIIKLVRLYLNSEPGRVPSTRSSHAVEQETAVPPTTQPGVVDTRSRLNLTTVPPGASVWIDDADTGLHTPCEYVANLRKDPSKTVYLELKANGYEDFCGEVNLRRSETLPIDIALTSIAPPKARVTAPVAPPKPPAAAQVLNSVPPPKPQITAPVPPPKRAVVAHAAGTVGFNPIDGAEMVYVPAGEFKMGSTDADLAACHDEKPARKVYLDGYWMYKYPVTVAQYRAYCHATGRKMPEPPAWGWPRDLPMIRVTYLDSVAYARWAHAALPTEAQWEKAARGTDGRIYPWGNEWDPSRCANSVSGNKLASPQPVGEHPMGASPYVALDIAGNVWEWCLDWYGENCYKSSPASNPTGPANGTHRVLRGGSAGGNYPVLYRAASRFKFIPTLADDYVGFRCLCPRTK